MSDMTILSARFGTSATIAACDRIFVDDLVLDCHIGVYAEEQGVTQKVGFRLEAAIAPAVRSRKDEIVEVPSYDDLTNAVKATLAEGHINLVETMAERIAERVLADKRILEVKVRIEKLERGPRAVGVEIVRPRRRG
ncbi:MAG: dihydroneopterin aldolase [Hyphomicrobiaceae bacterium]|nr:dihydroneopterin aldolase [Hyphomicrobiaceae bacterium]